MKELRLGMVEGRFADIIWDNAPLTSRELVELCREQLNWKRTTTYTVLKKLCVRGIFANNDSVVTPLLTREEFHALQSEQFVEHNYNGSLPAFITAFTTRRVLSEKELEEIKNLLAAYEEESR